MTVEHDAECAAHEEAVKILRERSHDFAGKQTILMAEAAHTKEGMAEVGKQLEATLADLHRHDIAYERVESGLRALSDRIPHTLGADLVAVSIGLKVVVTELDAVKSLVRSDLVGRQEFEPVKRLVYGMVGLVLTAVIVALIALVVKR